MSNPIFVPISVVIPTFKRTEDLFQTLLKIYKLDPQPSEIIIHVDGNDLVTLNMVREQFPEARLLISNDNIGPGGGRNRGVEAAVNEIVASFDDDSYPIDADYFQRLLQLFEKFPNASLIESSIYHKNEILKDDNFFVRRCYLFTGCGVAYRRSSYLKIGGYLPIAISYGIEESDFSLRAFAQNQLFIKTGWLRVFHNTILGHHSSTKINAAAVANLGLLVFLRYPKRLFGYGILQVLNRIIWSLKNKRYKGLINGIFLIPKLCYRYRKNRKIIHATDIKTYLLKRNSLENL